MTEFEKARIKYLPNKIKCLFIAESPPESDNERFFYFENVDKHDNLFKETMKVLYPDIAVDIKTIRREKAKFLNQFQKDGFYLIDSTDIPINKLSNSQKRKQIEKDLPKLKKKVSDLINTDTMIILISKNVYECCYDTLKTNGFNVVNKDKLLFPLGKWTKITEKA